MRIKKLLGLTATFAFLFMSSVAVAQDTGNAKLDQLAEEVSQLRQANIF